MFLGFMICMGMQGNGVKIGMEIIHRGRQQIPRGLQRERTVCCGTGLSTLLPRRRVLPAGSVARRLFGSATMGFVWRELRNYCLVTLLLMNLKTSAFCGGILHLRYVICRQTLPSCKHKQYFA